MFAGFVMLQEVVNSPQWMLRIQAEDVGVSQYELFDVQEKSYKPSKSTLTAASFLGMSPETLCCVKK